MSTVIYGISNCDTIKKARKWLTENNIDFQFHDFRKDGLAQTWLVEAENALGWEQLLNKRGTTYRQLDDAEKQDIDQAKALALLQRYPAMIKRPVLCHNGQFHLGFKPQQYAEIFA